MVLLRKPSICSKYEPSKEYMELDTIYKQDYCPYPVRSSVVCKPLQYKNTMDSLSTYRDDYQLWNCSKRVSTKPANAYHPPEERFDIRSTFQDHFQFWPINPVQYCKPAHVSSEAVAPFDDVTNYKMEYVPYHMEKIRLHKKEKYKPIEEPFDCITTNNQHYKGLPGNAAKPLKPIYSLTNWGIPFSSATEFQDEYKVWSQPPPHEKKSITYTKPTEKMDLLSTTRYDFIPHTLQPQVSCKPVRQYWKYSNPFEANSIMREDYKPWQCKKASPVKPRSDLDLPMGTFENMTTFKHDYIPHPHTHTMSFKPVNQTLMSSMPIDTQTIYGTSYTVKPIKMFHDHYKDPPGKAFLETDAFRHKHYTLLSENKNDSECTAAGQLSAKVSPPENSFMPPREMEAVV